jgi:predicted dithiol-disulfide oxidoreductase (DUF899 family)
MTDHEMAPEPSVAPIGETTASPTTADRDAFEAELGVLHAREKAHTHESDALASARRRLPMVEVDGTTALAGPAGTVSLLDAFEGRRQLVAYFHIWHPGRPAAEQCEGCTYYNGHIADLSFLHSRDATYATFCFGPYEQSVRYRDFLGLDMPWYSIQGSADRLLAGRTFNRFALVFYLRKADHVFETYWTNGRGVEAMSYSYGLLDRTVYGRQENWEDSPAGWPKRYGQLPDGSRPAYRIDGRPIAQWSRLAAGHSDELGAA